MNATTIPRSLLAITVLLAGGLAPNADAQTRSRTTKPPPQRVSPAPRATPAQRTTPAQRVSPARRTTPAQPDLTMVPAKTGKPGYRDGSLMIPIDLTVRNAGRGHAGPFRVASSYSIEGRRSMPQAARLLVDERPADVRGLRAGASVRLQGVIQIPDPRSALAGHSLRLSIEVDSLGKVRESNERNNRTASEPLRIPAPGSVVRTTPRQPVRVTPQREEPRQPMTVIPLVGTLDTGTVNPGIPQVGGSVKTAHPPGPTTPGSYATIQLQPVYRGNDGGAYYVMKSGNEVFFFGEHPGQEDYACVFRGTLSGSTIDGTWWDVPKGKRALKGTLKISIAQSGKRLVTTSQSGGFNVTQWDEIELGSFALPRQRPAGFTAATAGDLDGKWRAGDQSFYVREIGNDIVGVMESDFPAGGRPEYARVYVGARLNGGATWQAKYADIPKGLGIGSASQSFSVINAAEMQRAGGGLWLREAGLPNVETPAVFDVDQFAAEIEDRFGGKVIGYGYAIAKDGQIVKTGGGGNRMQPQDGGPLPFNGDTQKGVQSTAKTITAAAVMHLLHAKGLTIDTKIAPYLPAYWEKGLGVEFLTFGMLMKHRSGLVDIGDPDEFENLRKTIAAGISDDFSFIVPAFTYRNANFAMFRILIPYLENHGEMSYFEEVQGMKGSLLNKECSKRYVNYVRDHLLLPAGISNPTTYYSSTNIAWSYNFEKPDIGGRAHTTDQYYESGAGGWVLSAREFTKFLAALENEELLPVASLTIMKNERLGLFGKGGKAGTYYTHGGALGGGEDGAYGHGRGARSIHMIFPNKVQAYVQINSANNLSPAEGPNERRDALAAAYDACLP